MGKRSTPPDHRVASVYHTYIYRGQWYAVRSRKKFFPYKKQLQPISNISQDREGKLLSRSILYLPIYLGLLICLAEEIIRY